MSLQSLWRGSAMRLSAVSGGGRPGRCGRRRWAPCSCCRGPVAFRCGNAGERRESGAATEDCDGEDPDDGEAGAAAATTGSGGGGEGAGGLLRQNSRGKSRRSRLLLSSVVVGGRREGGEKNVRTSHCWLAK